MLCTKPAKVRAKAEMRSIPQQVAYWAKVGRAALDNPDLPIEFVRDAAGDGGELNLSSCLTHDHRAVPAPGIQTGL